jgi:hypothetical protein
MTSEPIDSLIEAFREQLLALLGECARGRWGLFGMNQSADAEKYPIWPEADRLRELAMALQAILAQSGERNALCEEFLDLCTIHGENDPGEPRLARTFLARIEKGQVGTPTEPDWKP